MHSVPAFDDTQRTPIETPQVVPPTASTWRVLVAPWYGIVNPVAAARTLSCGSRRAFVFACSIMLIAGACLTVLIFMWDASGTTRWVATMPPPNPTGTALTAPTPAVPTYSSERVEVSIGQVWADWHQDGWFGQAEYTLLVALFVELLAIVVLAWLFLPYIHSTGPIPISFGRSLRIAMAVAGLPVFTGAFLRAVSILHESRPPPWVADAWEPTLLLPLLPLLLAMVVVLGVSRHALSERIWRLRARLGAMAAVLVTPALLCLAYTLYVSPRSVLDEIVMLSYPCSFVLILYCIGHVIRSVRPAHAIDADLPPTCEGCGYDLTHQPDDQRCPECGCSTLNSLEPNLRRSDSTWERTGGVQSWIREFWAVLFKPGRFYGAMRVRTGDKAAVAFGRWNHVLLGIGGACGVLFVGSVLFSDPFRFSSEEFFAIPAAFGLGTALICWIGHRLGATLVVTLWMMRRSLPDYRWVRKIIEYESAFLWVYCAFWGVLLTTAALQAVRGIGPGFLGTMIRIGPIPMPLGFAVFVGGTAALSAVWYWRYQIALRAIRWNNF